MTEEGFVDFYSLLSIDIDTATKKIIQKAYREKSRTAHPDKGGDNETFHKLTIAYETLLDESKKKDYDQTFKAKKQRELKLQQMDKKKRRDRENLEERERLVKKNKIGGEDYNENLKNKLEENRLRTENYKELRNFQNKMENFALRNDKLSLDTPKNLDATLILKWKKKKFNFTKEDLMNIFKKNFNNYENLIFNDTDKEKKKMTAIISFSSILSANSVMNSKIEELQAFEIKWANGFPPAALATLLKENVQNQEEIMVDTNVPEGMSFEDYEELILMQTLDS
ncbi:DnaJ (Hsp40), sub C, member 17 [Clydaea vesicula]|uniref:DnaJ (Hsp40), sub C, member 17 n=1 Tax=Clydaea vesicula TaxID=447962 RepID=A0AAD5Y2V1_9FUNG|nr:DnaJ (Hsp40), sub C, member 17 [Clydaea vesicula]KAJ3395347.1 DnaJ (Hsp40), sub C, member 17 [Lobulomyces angularis]